MSPQHRFSTSSNPYKQQGLVLFIALTVLVAMTLAGIALLRQVGAGLGIIGNLAFKENATAAADQGVEAARAWLMTQTSVALTNDIGASGYFSGWDQSFNPQTYDWTGSNKSYATPNDGVGNDVRFVIHRLCNLSNVSVTGSGQQCVTLTVAGSDSTRIGLDASTQPLSSTVQPYYRVTARTTGPRNTISYVQVLMY